MTLEREQVLAFRFTGHHLDRRVDPETAAGATGLQDTPPGSAAVSLAARADGSAGELVTVYGMRGAPFMIPARDLPVFTTALRPPDDRAAATIIRNAAKAHSDVPPAEALARVAAAVADALDGRDLPSNDFHQALRERLGPELLWWCKNCGSHHVHPSLWRSAGLYGVLAVTGRAGRTAVYGLPPRHEPDPAAGAELVRRYLRAYGPSTRADFRLWAGIAPHHAKELWERVAEELEEIDLEGGRAYVLAEDARRVHRPPRGDGLRLVPGLDPYLAQRDRHRLVPDAEVRRRLWRPIGNPGAVLAGGEVIGLWRAAKKGAKLAITVEEIEPLDLAALEPEARRMAAARGCEDASILPAR